MSLLVAWYPVAFLCGIMTRIMLLACAFLEHTAFSTPLNPMLPAVSEPQRSVPSLRAVIVCAVSPTGWPFRRWLRYIFLHRNTNQWCSTKMQKPFHYSMKSSFDFQVSSFNDHPIFTLKVEGNIPTTQFHSTLPTMQTPISCCYCLATKIVVGRPRQK